jgi:hypothetical protein
MERGRPSDEAGLRKLCSCRSQPEVRGTQPPPASSGAPQTGQAAGAFCRPTPFAARAMKIEDQPLKIISMATNRPITQKPDTGQRARIINPQDDGGEAPDQGPGSVGDAAQLEGHHQAQDADAFQGPGQEKGEQAGGRHRVGHDAEAGQHLEHGDEGVPQDTPPPLAFEGLKDLDSAADDQEDPEKIDGGQGQPESHTQPDSPKDHQKDALGQEPAPVVHQVPQHRNRRCRDIRWGREG